MSNGNTTRFRPQQYVHVFSFLSNEVDTYEMNEKKIRFVNEASLLQGCMKWGYSFGALHIDKIKYIGEHICLKGNKVHL